ncbi:DUF4270 family protein [Dyadobacter sp. CY326]|uniref:DUF4270 family protein n=1 Tax=Dyadobacter sp. CY326 TaxID=2907300 RepID=UPI001F1FCCEE|nr:DUF4270 family protein [Dyadobacter sp. CY326]MCE7064098.1 DUF4270 domain-containing protein [Dyadobacter sp. CY326]
MKFNWYFLKKSATVFRLLIIFGITASLAGCDPSGDQIEAIVQPNVDDFSVQFTDTASVALSTVATDSVMTGGAARLLVGRYIDPIFGKFQSAAYFEPTISSAIVIPELAVYDSLTLSLRYDGYTHGDTTVAMNIAVHQSLADLLDKSSYYNTYAVPYAATPLGRVKFVPTPRESGTLKIKLSDNLGKQIFDKGKTNLLSSNTEWIDLVKGFALIPGANDNGPVVGFKLSDANTSVQLHYHTTENDGVKKDSTVIQTNIAYNRILADYKGTQLAKLPTTSRVSLPSAQTQNLSFIQAGLGVMTRIEFPTLRDLKANPYTVVNRAYLRITPLKYSVTKFNPAPPVLYPYLVDNNNEFFSNANGFPLQVTDLDGNLTQAEYIIDLVNNTAYYLLDVTGYVTTVLNLNSDNSPAILLRTSPFNKESTSLPAASTEFTFSATRLVIGDQQSNDSGVKLSLYVTAAKNKQ